MGWKERKPRGGEDREGSLLELLRMFEGKGQDVKLYARRGDDRRVFVFAVDACLLNAERGRELYAMIEREDEQGCSRTPGDPNHSPDSEGWEPVKLRAWFEEGPCPRCGMEREPAEWA